MNKKNVQSFKMFNILSNVGMNMQSEVCLWTLLGLVRTIFDATLFKMNANLKQVWQMTMPPELSMPVQRVLRTMISGVMLVQCFTVYVYLASYIVLLYPVFLEERPTLVLPWLLLAAIRKLLCELTSLALGLGTCLLLGPGRPPCIKFVIVKVASIMPAFYTWMLVYSYYHTLKITSAFKTFAAGATPSDPDYGLELAVRRRRTKSLLDENQLRTKLVASYYGERSGVTESPTSHPRLEISSRMIHSTDTSLEDIKGDTDIMNPLSVTSNKLLEAVSYEDWYGNDLGTPRDTDRILEQFVIMLLRIGIHLKKEGVKPIASQIFASRSGTDAVPCNNLNGTAISSDETDTPPLVGSCCKYPPSYLREYPQIFMKKASDVHLSMPKKSNIRHVRSQIEHTNSDNNHAENTEDTDKIHKSHKHSTSVISSGLKSVTIDKVARRRLIQAENQHKSENEPQTSKASKATSGENGITDQGTCIHLLSGSESSESLKSVIKRMKNRLSENKKSSNEFKRRQKKDD